MVGSPFQRGTLIVLVMPLPTLHIPIAKLPHTHKTFGTNFEIVTALDAGYREKGHASTDFDMCSDKEDRLKNSTLHIFFFNQLSKSSMIACSDLKQAPVKSEKYRVHVSQYETHATSLLNRIIGMPSPTETLATSLNNRWLISFVAFQVDSSNFLALLANLSREWHVSDVKARGRNTTVNERNQCNTKKAVCRQAFDNQRQAYRIKLESAVAAAEEEVKEVTKFGREPKTQKGQKTLANANFTLELANAQLATLDALGTHPNPWVTRTFDYEADVGRAIPYYYELKGEKKIEFWQKRFSVDLAGKFWDAVSEQVAIRANFEDPQMNELMTTTFVQACEDVGTYWICPKRRTFDIGHHNVLHNLDVGDYLPVPRIIHQRFRDIYDDHFYDDDTFPRSIGTVFGLSRRGINWTKAQNQAEYCQDLCSRSSLEETRTGLKRGGDSQAAED